MVINGSVKNYAQISLQTWWINPAGKGDIIHYPSISAKKHEDGGKLPLTIQFSPMQFVVSSHQDT